MSFLQAIKDGITKRETEEEFRLFRLKYDRVLDNLLYTVQRINNEKEEQIRKKIEKQSKIPPPNRTIFTSCHVKALVCDEHYTFLCKFTYLSDGEIKFWITDITIRVLYIHGTYNSCKRTFLSAIPECYYISPDLVVLEMQRI